MQYCTYINEKSPNTCSYSDCHNSCGEAQCSYVCNARCQTTCKEKTNSPCMGLATSYFFIQTFFLFHIKYMRKGNESGRSDNARGITRMSDDQRLGLIMII